MRQQQYRHALSVTHGSALKTLSPGCSCMQPSTAIPFLQTVHLFVQIWMGNKLCTAMLLDTQLSRQHCLWVTHVMLHKLLLITIA